MHLQIFVKRSELWRFSYKSNCKMDAFSKTP